MAEARSLSSLLDEHEQASVLRLPRVREHVRQGEEAAWMHTFALLLLARVASGTTALERASTEFSLTLAVEAAYDAYAHWATALEQLGDPSESSPPAEHPLQ